MKNELLALWQRISASGNAEAIYNILHARYNLAYKFYHTEEHIDEGLVDFKEIKSSLEFPDETELAWIFHDAIYKPKKSNNEAKSAELLVKVCGYGKISTEFSERASRRVIVTDHKTPPISFDELAMVDLDLAIFGKPEERFNQYEEAIRKEYFYAPNSLYRQKRAEILTFFKNKPYNLSYFQEKYESQKQKNLERAIQQLR